MPKTPAAKAASADVKKEQTETEEAEFKPEVEVPPTPRKRKAPSGGAEASPSPSKKGKGGWSGEAKGKLATFMLDKGYTSMTTEDWNTIADQIGVTPNQCKDQFKPKRSNVRSALQGMFDGM